MTPVVRIVLLLCAALAFGGAGVAIALGRHRCRSFDETNPACDAVAFLLVLFGALCAGFTGGVASVGALMLPVGAAGYAFTAQRLGLFRISTGDIPVYRPEKTGLHT
jgi:hypothetical protein